MVKRQSTDARSQALADALSGVGAALIALWVFYPIDVWKTHAQAGMKPPPLRRMMSSGLETKSLHTASSSFFYFYLYSWILSTWTTRIPLSRKNEVSVTTRLLLSAIAAMMNTCLTLPLDVISTRHQTMKTQSETDFEQEDMEQGEQVKNDDDSFLILRQQVKRFHSLLGWKMGNLWKGLRPSLILCSNPAINVSIILLLLQKFEHLIRVFRSLSKNCTVHGL